MNINSFITCPACCRMHDARVEICGSCGFSHVKVEEVSVGTDDIDVPVVDTHEAEPFGETALPDPTNG